MSTTGLIRPYTFRLKTATLPACLNTDQPSVGPAWVSRNQPQNTPNRFKVELARAYSRCLAVLLGLTSTAPSGRPTPCLTAILRRTVGLAPEWWPPLDQLLRATSAGWISVRRRRNDGCRISPASVHSRKVTSHTSCGRTKRAPLGGPPSSSVLCSVRRGSRICCRS